MKIIKCLVIAAILIALGLSCVEPFDIRSISYDKAIVVEGRFTNEQKAHYVKLSYTRAIDEKENVPLTSATVWVEEADGTKIEFKETAPGHYENTEKIPGVAGSSYRLFFTTSEGIQYQSKPQGLLASPPIIRVYDEYAEKANTTTGDIMKGIQFFVDTYDETNSAQYFRYEWEETYEVYASFPSYYEFFSNPDTVLARTEDVSPCYVSDRSTAITLGSTATLTESRLSEMPVRYITSETEHLLNTYSLLVRQYVISAEAYSFYREILENNHDNASLFDKQLGVIVGNISAVGDPDETVLGFFEVSGVSEQRAFFKYTELDKRFPWPKVQYPCNGPNQLIRISTSDSVDYYVNGLGYGIISAEYCFTIKCENNFNAMLAPRYCTDCRFRGSTDKPDFWIY